MSRRLRLCWLFFCLLFPASAAGAGVTEVVSVNTSGELADHGATRPAISADGRYVAFLSMSANLTPILLQSGYYYVFLRDRAGQTTELISVDDDLNPLIHLDDLTAPPGMSSDGRFVGFVVSEEVHITGTPIVVRDRLAGTTEGMHISAEGEAVAAFDCDARGYRLHMSADGRFVAFDSCSDELVSGDTNEARDVFIRDRVNLTTERLSVNTLGQEGGWYENSAVGAMSGDGQVVAFYSEAALTGDPADRYFIRDRTTQTTEGVAHGGLGALSSDGRFAVYGYVDGLYVMDRETREVEFVDVGSVSSDKAMSADGRFVAFASESEGIVPGDDNRAYDVFVYDRYTGDIEAVSVNAEGDFGDGDSMYPAIDASGRYVAFVSFATNLAPGLTDGRWQVFVRDRGPQTCEARITVSGTNGHVEVDGIAQALPWSEVYPCGTEITLNAVPEGTCEIFLGWGDDLAGDENPITVVMDEAKSITAVFGFSDVPCDYWSASEIRACAEAGVVQGYGDGTYVPEEPVTRAAMAVYVARAEGWVQLDDDMGSAPELFSDLPAGHWAGRAILECVANNVVQGYPDGTYQPLSTVTRDQMAVYVARALVAPAGDTGVPDGPSMATFSDVPTDYWSYGHVEYCVDQGVVQGYDGGYYQPLEDVTRGQMAVYVAGAFGLTI